MDVAIVGAGVSGLSTAVALHAAGRRVRVLEARARVGGRLESRDGLDLGATWFWPGEERVRRLTADLGLATHAQHLAGDAVHHEQRGVLRLEGNPLDVPSSRVVGGTQALAHGLAASLPDGVVRLGVPVTGVHVHDEGVRLTTGAGPVAARHVVLAVPPALATHAVLWDPPLPPELAAVARSVPTWMGGSTKVLVRYDRPFWREAGLSGSGMSHVGPLRELHDASGPEGVPAALFGFATSSPTTTIDSADVVAQLVALFGPPAADPLEVVVRDWAREVRTSSIDVPPSTQHGLFGHHLLTAPAMGGRVHFTSTETSTTHPGHVEGALQAAERTVETLLAATSASGNRDLPR